MKLRAGDLTMVYDSGFLRYINLGDHEVLRMIYFALRDRNWDTMPGEVVDEQISTARNSFKINYTWKSTTEKFPFIWQVEIEGKENEEIIFSIDGLAQNDILKNRTGFCVLHPISENVNNACTIYSPSGEMTTGHFPEHISPHQPFIDIAKMEWPLGLNGHASIIFEGDIFEMEDQRNWTDDSFKTYCTPLSVPFPALLKKGEKVQQRLILSVVKERFNQPAENKICVLTPTVQLDAIPAKGIGAVPFEYDLSPPEVRLLRKLEFDFYRVEIDFSVSHWFQVWDKGRREALALKLNLDLCLTFSKQYLDEARRFCQEIASLPAETAVNILLVQKGHKVSPDLLLQEVAPLFKSVAPRIKIGGGTTAYFTELNRERIPTTGLDFISYTINPQAHAFDDATLAENLGAQEYTVVSARKYFNCLPVHISPITLKPRFNPNATEANDADDSAQLASIDPRQKTLFGAIWTLGSIRHLASAGASLTTYFQALGPGGVMDKMQLSKNPEHQVVRLFPMYQVFRILLSHKSSNWVPLESTLPLQVKGIALQIGDRSFLLIGNLKNSEITVSYRSACTLYRVTYLEKGNLEEAALDPDYMFVRLTKSDFTQAATCVLILPPNAMAYAEIIH